jgi:hypothetical protein
LRFFQQIDGELSWQSGETLSFPALQQTKNNGGGRRFWISVDEIASCCLTAGMPLN